MPGVRKGSCLKNGRSLVPPPPPPPPPPPLLEILPPLRAAPRRGSARLPAVENGLMAVRLTRLLTCTAPAVRRTPALAGGARGFRCREGQGARAKGVLPKPAWSTSCQAEFGSMPLGRDTRTDLPWSRRGCCRRSGEEDGGRRRTTTPDRGRRRRRRPRPIRPTPGDRRPSAKPAQRRRAGSG